MDQRTTARAEQAIVRLCYRGLDARTLRTEFLLQLRMAVPVDAYWFATADPATLLFTGSVVEEIPEQATPAFLANEFSESDVNKWVQLASASRPTEGMFLATRGQLGASARYRDILAPLGFGDELRAALRDGATCWGFLCLHRAQGNPNFTAEDAAFMARISPHLAAGLRAALLIANADVGSPNDEGPGLL